jgi:diguanylate cyclase (GGDEF)-like protein
MGNIAALWRRDLGADAEARLAELEAVGKAARTALANAIRFDGVSELSIRDGPSGLFNRRYFLGRLAEEVTRAHRRASLLTLVLFEVSPTSSSAGDPDSSPMLHEVGRRVQSLMSGTETPCRLGGGEFAIVMPDSSISDAEALVERLGDVLDEAQPIGVVIAQLLHEEDHDSLFRRASAALLYSKRRDELHVATERPASSTAGTART